MFLPKVTHQTSRAKMQVVSVNVGLPREVEWRHDLVSTAIHKSPVRGPIAVRRLNLDGDRQADLSVHGGPEKAVYVYPSEHYPQWREELPGVALPWAAFGENLTSEGILEPNVHIGDVLRIGTAELVVTQPRMPCFKLNVRFQRSDMVKRFLRTGRSGFYLAVLQEGQVEAGDSIELVPTSQPAVTISEVAALYTTERGNQELMQRALQTPGMPQGWREWFREQLAGAAARH
jgi:MOSC domain-containing protein YiiM